MGVLSEATPEFFKQLLVDGRVRDANVINGVDDALTQEVRPNNVREVGREVGVLGRRQPIGHDDSPIFTDDVRLLAAEEFGGHHNAADEMSHIAAAAIEDHEFARVFGLLPADLSEEGREAVIVIHLPTVERMIVALSTLNSHAHKDLRDVLRDF